MSSDRSPAFGDVYELPGADWRVMVIGQTRDDEWPIAVLWLDPRHEEEVDGIDETWVRLDDIRDL
jgi:hypothetical protein